VAESLTLADVVPAANVGSALDSASDEEQRLWILDQLRGFTREQRRAFTLYTLEGWNADEVAALQARAPEAVLLDVEHVRSELAAKLQDAEAVTR
jgi:DNA-directed RNA polymerase specialized sigma24 family protein